MTAQAWLDIATYGLAPSAARQVRAEHLSHLEDALSAGESQAGVVAGWGDPHRAAHQLRRAHPKVSDVLHLPPLYARNLAGLREAYRREWLIPAIALIFAPLTVLLTQADTVNWPGLFLVVALFCVYPVLRWAVGWPGRALRQRVWLGWLTDPLTLVAVFNTADVLLRGHWNLAQWSTLDWLRMLFVPWALYRLHRGLDATRHHEATA